MNTIVIALLVFGMLVFIHEFGHFLVAKLVGIKVLEFSIGFGPQLFDFKSQETEYSLRLLPLGGFVRLEGEEEETQDPRAFNNKPVLARMGVIIAGPMMNFILAVVLISVISFFSGTATTKISVVPNGPAALAGLKNGDIIYTIEDQKVNTWEEIVALIGQKPDKSIKIQVLRDDDILSYNIKTDTERETNRGIIGVKAVVEKHSIVKSIKSGINTTFWVMKTILTGLFKMLKGQTKADVVGPVGIVHIVGEAAKIGLFNVLYLAAIISINLGLFNLFPIPALDGSKIVFLGIELIKGRPLDQEKEGFIHFIGFALLMILMIFILFKDIRKLNLLR